MTLFSEPLAVAIYGNMFGMTNAKDQCAVITSQTLRRLQSDLAQHVIRLQSRRLLALSTLGVLRSNWLRLT